MIEYKQLTIDDTDIFQSIVKRFRDQDITTEKAVDFLTNPTNIVYAAHDDRQAAGYILCYRLNRMDNGHDMLTVYHLFVLEEYRRQGIAKRLLEMILDFAKKEQLHYVWLITQYDNDAANALYRSCGGYNHPKDKEVYFWFITGKPQI